MPARPKLNDMKAQNGQVPITLRCHRIKAGKEKISVEESKVSSKKTDEPPKEEKSTEPTKVEKADTKETEKKEE